MFDISQLGCIIGATQSINEMNIKVSYAMDDLSKVNGTSNACRSNGVQPLSIYYRSVFCF